MKHVPRSTGSPLATALLLLVWAGCAGETGAGDETTGASPSAADPDVITSVEAALPGVFIPPYEACSEPLDDVPGAGPDGQVCTNVAISGSTEEDRYFPDYGSCDVVRTQRPFWEVPPAATPDPADPRLDDDAFMTELAWAKDQIAASGCVCCHDSRQGDGRVGQWDIAAEPIWITTLSDSGLALFAGFADSSVLGAYPPAHNNGFDRTTTGIPTTDTERMLAFLRAEMEHRGFAEADARAIPPFGGPIYAASIAPSEPCGAGQGVSPDGIVQWTGGAARYVYVTEPEADNPGVPPNLDLPDGTLWRLDVRADAEALASGIAYGAASDGTRQRMPVDADAPALETGARYKLFALADVGLPITSCLFTFGDEVIDDGAGDDGASPNDPAAACEGDEGFGATCTTDADCGCAAASYCAIMPGQRTGECTATGCTEDPSVCPDGWSCFDISIFAPGQPSICTGG